MGTNRPLTGFKNIFTGGEESEKLIKSGTLFVTRGAGIIGIGLLGLFYALDQLADKGPWQGLATDQKLDFVVAVGFVWAIVAAADALARSITTGAKSIHQGLIASRDQLVVLDPPLDGALKVQDNRVEAAKIRAVRLTPGDTTKIAAFLLSYNDDGTTVWKTEGVTLGKPS